MAKKAQARPVPDPEYDSFVLQVVQDPKNPPEPLLLSGYTGPGSENEYLRLYFNLNLTDYVDIPTDKILYMTKIPTDDSPMGGYYVWIEKDAELLHGKASEERLPANWLKGRIQYEYQRIQQGGAFEPGVKATPGGVAPIPPVSMLYPCTTTGATQTGKYCKAHCEPRCTYQYPQCPVQTREITRCVPCPTDPANTRECCKTIDPQDTVCPPCITQNQAITECLPCPTRPNYTPCCPTHEEATPCCPTRPGMPDCMTQNPENPDCPGNRTNDPAGTICFPCSVKIDCRPSVIPEQCQQTRLCPAYQYQAGFAPAFTYNCAQAQMLYFTRRNTGDCCMVDPYWWLKHPYAQQLTPQYQQWQQAQAAQQLYQEGVAQVAANQLEPVAYLTYPNRGCWKVTYNTGQCCRPTFVMTADCCPRYTINTRYCDIQVTPNWQLTPACPIQLTPQQWQWGGYNPYPY